MLSWSSDGTLRLWGSTGEAGQLLHGHTDGVRGARQLSDGRLLSWSADGTLRLWSSTGEPLAIYVGDAAITCCVPLRDGRIAVGEAGGRFYILRING